MSVVTACSAPSRQGSVGIAALAAFVHASGFRLGIYASPAERAGLRATDVILDADGVPLNSAGDLQRLMVGGAIGRSLHLRVLRGDAVVDVVAVPIELAD